MKIYKKSAKTSVIADAENYKSCLQYQTFLTLDTVRGMLKSLPPCSLKPQGAGPLRVIEYTFIAFGEKKEGNSVLISQEAQKRFPRPHIPFCFIRAAGYLQLYPTLTHTFHTESDISSVFFQSMS